MSEGLIRDYDERAFETIKDGLKDFGVIINSIEKLMD